MLNDDYIKRSDVLQIECDLCLATHCKRDYKCSKAIRINNLPAADVEGKRMPGVWLEQDETPNVSSDKIYRCSVCDYADEQSPTAEVPYCWHCGSRMKKMFPKSKEAENAFQSN